MTLNWAHVVWPTALLPSRSLTQRGGMGLRVNHAQVWLHMSYMMRKLYRLLARHGGLGIERSGVLPRFGGECFLTWGRAVGLIPCHFESQTQSRFQGCSEWEIPSQILPCRIRNHCRCPWCYWWHLGEGTLVVIKHWVRGMTAALIAGVAASGKYRLYVNGWVGAFLRDVDRAGWRFAEGVPFVMKNV